MASVPYRAEAPSSSTSTRCSAAAGILFRSTPVSSPGEAKLAMRRPLSSTRVDEVPTPRRLALLKPRWSPPTLMLAPSVRPPTLADTRAISSAAVVTPAFSMSARVMICTGSAVSDSSRLMAEPVISTRRKAGSISASSVCASAPWPMPSAAVMPSAPSARRTERASSDSRGTPRLLRCSTCICMLPMVITLNFYMDCFFCTALLL